MLNKKGSTLHWFCNHCEAQALTAVKTDNLIREKCCSLFKDFRGQICAEFASKFTEIDSKFKVMQTQLERMDERRSVGTDDTLDTRLTELQKQMDEVKEKQKFRLFSHVVRGGEGKSDVEVEAAEQSAHVVQLSAREMEDRKSRETKLVWFGIPEKDSEDVEVRKKADLSFVTELGQKVFKFEKGVFKNAVRLGKRAGKDRPLLTVVDTSDRVGEILRGARTFRSQQEYSNISVKKDMTPLEREEQRRLVSVRNQKREEAEKNETGEWFIIRKGRVVNVTRRKAAEAAGEEKEGD